MRDVVGGLLRFLVILALIAAVALVVLRAFFVDTCAIGDNDMAPTLIAGDTAAVWRTDEFSRGDIVLCAHPTIAGRMVVGRIVGKPGDRLRADANAIVLNDIRVDVDWSGTAHLGDQPYARGTAHFGNDDHPVLLKQRGRFTMTPRTVRTGFFLLADNRSAQSDSRSYGEVNPASCVGQLVMRLSAAELRSDLGGRALDLLK